MDSSCHKFYPEHGFDSREHLETYFSNKEEMGFGDDTLKFPMECLHHAFNDGNIKGDILIDISYGSFIHHLYMASAFFKKIYILKCSERCIMELNKWINTRTGAFDWSHVTPYIKNTEGNSDQCQDSDIMLKTAIAQIVKCDYEKQNLTDPEELPLADCLISAAMLELISKDQDGYLINFRKFVKLLKPKGYLVLMGVLNATYKIVGQDKIHMLKYDETIVRQVLTDEKFIIDHWAVQKRTAVSDLTDYEAVIFITAHRE